MLAVVVESVEQDAKIAQINDPSPELRNVRGGMDVIGEVIDTEACEVYTRAALRYLSAKKVTAEFTTFLLGITPALNSSGGSLNTNSGPFSASPLAMQSVEVTNHRPTITSEEMRSARGKKILPSDSEEIQMLGYVDPYILRNRSHGIAIQTDGEKENEDCRDPTPSTRAVLSLLKRTTKASVFPPANTSPSSSVRRHEEWVHDDRSSLHLFCAIFTHAPAHEQARAVAETWAPNCDGYIGYSSTTDPDIGTVELPIRGREHYFNMFQKSRAIWKHLATHYVDPTLLQKYGAATLLGRECIESNSTRTSGPIRKRCGIHIEGRQYFDWFLLGGDDLYVRVATLRQFLTSPEVSQPPDRPLYLGRPLRRTHNLVYNTGGSGYLLNARALAILMGQFARGGCYPFKSTSLEDVVIGQCLRDVGLIARNTSDQQGRERFHWQSPDAAFEASNPFYLMNSNARYGQFPVRGGRDCCSPESISFQDLKPASTMRCFHLQVQRQEKEDV
jgi:glycoprotein-N-acetylgalactosamine 3-beta-galactosyltransferase